MSSVGPAGWLLLRHTVKRGEEMEASCMLLLLPDKINVDVSKNIRKAESQIRGGIFF